MNLTQKILTRQSKNFLMHWYGYVTSLRKKLHWRAWIVKSDAMKTDRRSVSSHYRVASVYLVSGYTKNRDSSWRTSNVSLDSLRRLCKYRSSSPRVSSRRRWTAAAMAVDCSRKSLPRQTGINGGPNGYKLIWPTESGKLDTLLLKRQT